MNTLFSYSALGSGLLLGSMLSLSGAEPIKPTFPTGTAPTNTLAITRPIPITLPELPYFQQPFPHMLRQRLSERAIDPLTPANLNSVVQNRGSYDRFTHDTGRNVLEGAGKQALQDWATQVILPSFELNGKPLSEIEQGLIYGSIEGVSRRDLRPRDSMYTFSEDLTLRPKEQHPLPYSGGLDLLRTNPKFNVTITTRDSTRVVRVSSSYNIGEASFDVHDDALFIRFGVRGDYRDFKNGSSGFISLTPRSRLPLNFSVGSNVKGDWTASVGMHFKF